MWYLWVFCFFLIVLQSCGVSMPSTRKYVISHTEDENFSQAEEVEED